VNVLTVAISREQAWGEWLKPHQGSFEQVLIKTLLLLHEAASLTNVEPSGVATTNKPPNLTPFP
jgi:hypothetical protein